MDGGVVEVPKEEDGASRVWATGGFDPGREAREGGGPVGRAVNIDIDDQCPAQGDCKGLEVVIGEGEGPLEP